MADKNDTVVRYALAGTTQPVAVSRYDLAREDQEALPSEDALVSAFRSELTEGRTEGRR